MPFEISTKARNVLGFEHAEEVHRIPLFIGVTPEPTGDGIRVLIDVAFQRIKISAPHGCGPWFSAASDAQLRVRADEGIIGECTDTKYVSAEISEEDAVETKNKAELKPEVKVSDKLTISVFSVGGGNKKASTRTSTFSKRKGDVAVTKLGSSVVWDGLKGLNESAIGQSLAGNISLWATCGWRKKIGSGSVELRAFYDFFTADGKKLSKIKSVFAGIIAGLKPDVLETEKTRIVFRVTSDENS